METVYPYGHKGFVKTWQIATEAAERALIGDTAAREHKATAYGLYHMVVGLAALPGAVLFGALWQWVGEMAAFFTAASLSLLSLVVLWRFILLRQRS